MASTYSALKIELIGTGDQSGTWGSTTNVNLGTAIEQAITGTGDVTFSNADVTLTLTDSNGSQTARNLRLNLVGAVTGAQNLIVPSIEKLYLINNQLTYDITVKNSSGTGVAVPAGKSTFVFNDGTNVGETITALPTGTVLPVANGGTGATTASGARTNLSAAVSGANSDITSLTGLTTPLSVAQGGSGATSTIAYSVLCGGTTSTSAIQAVASVGTSGQILTSNGAGTLPTFQTPAAQGFASGTVLIFGQTSAPTGWTKDTTTAANNSALRCTTSTVGSGGTVAFTTAFASQAVTGSVSVTSVSGSAGATTLTTPQIPSHTHQIQRGGIQKTGNPYFAQGTSGGGAVASLAEGGDGSHDHPFNFTSGSASFTGTDIDLAVKYIDVIRATKD